MGAEGEPRPPDGPRTASSSVIVGGETKGGHNMRERKDSESNGREGWREGKFEARVRVATRIHRPIDQKTDGVGGGREEWETDCTQNC